MKKFLTLRNHIKHCLYLFYYKISIAQDMIGISDVDNMLTTGKSIVQVAAKWGGIITVVGAALALGSGRMEGGLAQTICKIFVVIGLLISAFTFFGNKISWGFTF